MVELRLLNGSKKITVIETFDSHAVIISPEGRQEFKSLEKCKEYISEAGFEVNISHLFGSSIKREIQNQKEAHNVNNTIRNP